MSIQDLNRQNNLFTKQLLDKAKRNEKQGKKVEPVKEITESKTDTNVTYELDDIKKIIQ